MIKSMLFVGTILSVAVLAAPVSGDTQITQSYSCCANGDFYGCPSQDEAIKCLKSQRNACTRDASRDNKCQSEEDLAGGADLPKAPAAQNQAFGAVCQYSDECASGICFVMRQGDFGYCTKMCDSFADCPTFWDCERGSNTSHKMCKQPRD